jgi:ATP-dependent RNA helicase DeaD
LGDFKSLGIHSSFIKGLHELGIVEPTEIQRQVIPILVQEDTDLVGQAQTGTGKTAAYGLPLLAKVDPENNVPQGLILCPTRELCKQVAKQLFKFTKYTDKIFAEAVFGGEKIEKQIIALRRPTHIIVATPGRLIDLVRRKSVDIRQVHTVVMDEADEMLSMGFKAELDEILTMLASVQNKWLFSATLPQGIKQIINTHIRDGSYRIQVSGKNVVNQNIRHQYILCEKTDKHLVLFQLLKNQGENRGIIFCKTKNAVKTLVKQLIAKNYSADAIHGDLLQKERNKAMRAFKGEKVQYLVATDLAARGIDVQDLAFVYHFQLPDQVDYYTHRAGRTARAGKDGISLCLITKKELRDLKKLENELGIEFKQKW